MTNLGSEGYQWFIGIFNQR